MSVPIGQQDNIWWVLGFLCSIGRQRLGLPIRAYEMQWLKTLFRNIQGPPKLQPNSLQVLQCLFHDMRFFSLSDASLVETPRRGSAGPLMATPWVEEQGGSSFIIITHHHVYFLQASVLFLRKECKIWAPLSTNFGSFTHFWVYFLQA